MRRSRIWRLVMATAAASVPLVAASAGGRAAGQAAGGGVEAADAGTAPSAPAWLPKGCELILRGPRNAGYKACPAPEGFRPPNGYMLANTAQAPKVHAKTGASGAPPSG